MEKSSIERRSAKVNVSTSNFKSVAIPPSAKATGLPCDNSVMVNRESNDEDASIEQTMATSERPSCISGNQEGVQRAGFVCRSRNISDV